MTRGCVNSSQKTKAGPSGRPRRYVTGSKRDPCAPAAQYVPYISSPYPPRFWRDHCIVALFDCFLEENGLIVMSSTVLEATAT